MFVFLAIALMLVDSYLGFSAVPLPLFLSLRCDVPLSSWCCFAVLPLYLSFYLMLVGVPRYLYECVMIVLAQFAAALLHFFVLGSFCCWMEYVALICCGGMIRSTSYVRHLFVLTSLLFLLKYFAVSSFCGMIRLASFRLSAVSGHCNMLTLASFRIFSWWVCDNFLTVALSLSACVERILWFISDADLPKVWDGTLSSACGLHSAWELDLLCLTAVFVCMFSVFLLVLSAFMKMFLLALTRAFSAFISFGSADCYRFCNVSTGVSSGFMFYDRIIIYVFLVVVLIWLVYVVVFVFARLVFWLLTVATVLLFESPS